MKFGVRECADVVLRAKSAQKIGNKIFYKNEPVCYFDTLKTSTFEGAATTVYAQGGRGNARLMSWDGERTVTFTMEDALISPIGLSILTGAGLIDATDLEKGVIQHLTEQVDKESFADDSGTKKASAGIYVTKKPYEDTTVANDTTTYNDSTIYVMILDDNGEVSSEPYLFKYDSEDTDSNGNKRYKIVPAGNTTGTTFGDTAYTNDTGLTTASLVLVDYYTAHETGAMQINITPDKFGGTFYLEASTLWRDQGSGQDLPAEFIIPSCKVQSNFSFTLASSGDPSSFTFTMDAFPDYTRWDRTEKVLAAIQVIGGTLEGKTELRRANTVSTDTATDEGIIVRPTAAPANGGGGGGANPPSGGGG